MATTRKKTEVVQEVKTADEKDIQIENLTKQNSDLMKNLEDMMGRFTALESKLNMPTETKNETSSIDMNAMMKVTSMLNNTYNLSTTRGGKGGKVYSFEKYGETKPIRVRDLIEIISTYSNQFEDGWVILQSKADYEKLDIGYMCDGLLDTKTMSELAMLTKVEHVEIISELNDVLKESVLSLIANNLVSGKMTYDFNMIEKLKKVCNIQDYIDSATEEKEEREM